MNQDPLEETIMSALNKPGNPFPTLKEHEQKIKDLEYKLQKLDDETEHLAGIVTIMGGVGISILIIGFLWKVFGW